MSLNYNMGKIKNWKDVVWLDIPKDDPDWSQEILERNYRMGQGSYARENPDDDTSPFVKYFNPVTDALIWATLETQIGEITEKNWKEVWMRMAMVDGMNGGRLHEYDKEKEDWIYRSITREEVYQHIGLSTNVFPKESTTKWYNKMLARVQDVKIEEETQS